MENISKKVETLNANEEFLKAIIIENEDEIMANSIRTEGEARGRKEEKLETARAMLKDNVPVQTISTLYHRYGRYAR